MRRAVEQVTGQPPRHVTTPGALAPHLRRQVETSTLGDLPQRDDWPRFVKPLDVPKAFPAGLVHSADEAAQLLAPRAGYPVLTKDFSISVQAPVRLVSEWRAFVIRGAVINLSHYLGDALRLPNPSTIRLAVGAYTGAPAGYAADFGLTEAGQTLLVEVNDGYALGSGGLPAALYARLLQARWEELCSR